MNPLTVEHGYYPPAPVHRPAGDDGRCAGAEGPEPPYTGAGHRLRCGPARQRAGALLPR